MHFVAPQLDRYCDVSFYNCLNICRLLQNHCIVKVVVLSAAEYCALVWWCSLHVPADCLQMPTSHFSKPTACPRCYRPHRYQTRGSTAISQKAQVTDSHLLHKVVTETPWCASSPSTFLLRMPTDLAT